MHGFTCNQLMEKGPKTVLQNELEISLYVTSFLSAGKSVSNTRKQFLRRALAWESDMLLKIVYSDWKPTWHWSQEIVIECSFTVSRSTYSYVLSITQHSQKYF